jgi:hypothetical protein
VMANHRNNALLILEIVYAERIYVLNSHMKVR